MNGLVRKQTFQWWQAQKRFSHTFFKNMNTIQLWKRYQEYFCVIQSVNFSLDISRINFNKSFFHRMEPRIQKAFTEMEKLEKGALANPDEKRMVGHYWLRAPELAPTAEIRKAIEIAFKRIKAFTDDVHQGRLSPEKGGKFTDLLIIGIGGSALGPQFVSHALGDSQKDKLRIWFFDNTDPDGIDLVLSQIQKNSRTQSLVSTLTIVISKSGATKETRNGQLEAKAAYKKFGLNFTRHAVAITGEGSELSQTASRENWLAQFPMWDWIGGRTSELSAVGLLPAALQGIDIDSLLQGACLMDSATRSKKTLENPAALLALMWFHATGAKGSKDMVILPYKDRLILFSRYLQQLVMESLGKERDLKGRKVYQGIAVYGNKGSTDQHAYVQQLREGVPNFFITFIEVLRDRNTASFFVDPNITSGDYLHGFYQGTRHALYENNRQSITLTVPDVSAQTVGALIALYERAVGLYASLIGINAYHQPGVEAGKKAANTVLAIQKKISDQLSLENGKPLTAAQLSKLIGMPDQIETIYQILRHLAANLDRGIRAKGIHPSDTTFWKEV